MVINDTIAYQKMKKKEKLVKHRKKYYKMRKKPRVIILRNHYFKSNDLENYFEKAGRYVF